MNRKNRQILRRAVSRKIMEDFFKKEVLPHYYPKATLASFKLKDQSSYQFKKAARYTLGLLYPNGKNIEKIVRGNVPSVHQAWEITVSHQVLEYLYEHGFNQGKYRVSKPLGYYPKERLQLYEELPGEIFSERIKKQKKGLEKDTKLASSWVAKFHNLKTKIGRPKTLKRIREEIGYFVRNYKRYSSELYFDGKNILNLFYHHYKKYYSPKKHHLIHGDLNANNIIINNNNVGVIDFGNSWRFDPFCEIANYLIQLELISWRGEAPQKLVQRLNQLFIKNYLNKTNQNNPKAHQLINLWKVWWMMQITAFSCNLLVDTKKNRLDLEKTIIRYTLPLSKNIFKNWKGKTK